MRDNLTGQWSWQDSGALLDYSNWYENQPFHQDHDCLSIRTEWNGAWDNKDCGIIRPFICEKHKQGMHLQNVCGGWNIFFSS